MLKIENLVKIYFRAGTPFKALDDINLTINSGDFVHIIGRSGSGKSTLLNIVAGLLNPNSGAVSLNGVDYLKLDDDKKSLFRNENIGFIPQSASLLSYLNVLENIMLPYELYDRDGDAKAYAMHLLYELNIKHLAESYPKELSGGEAKKVMIARSLINKPKILIADEPTSDLDIENTKDIMEYFTKINEEGTTVLVVTHELDTIKYGKEVYTMSEGKLTKGKHI